MNTKYIIAITTLLFSTLSFAASITPANPSKENELLRTEFHEFVPNVFGYVNVRKFSDEIYYELHFSNGSNIGFNLPYFIECKDSSGKQITHYNGNQHLGSSSRGSVERSNFFKIDCPSSGKISVSFGKANQDYNVIDWTLKAVVAYFFPMTW